jgi:hypothetical protein
MTFEEFVAEIQKLAEECGAAEPGKQYCDPSAWADMFKDDFTPAEAWAEEVSAAASMIG